MGTRHKKRSRKNRCLKKQKCQKEDGPTKATGKNWDISPFYNFSSVCTPLLKQLFVHKSNCCFTNWQHQIPIVFQILYLHVAFVYFQILCSHFPLSHPLLFCFICPLVPPPLRGAVDAWVYWLIGPQDLEKVLMHRWWCWMHWLRGFMNFPMGQTSFFKNQTKWLIFNSESS